jgi:WD40 repeat protein
MKVVKSLLTLLVMGVPIWVALIGFIRFDPASLVVHVEEQGVQVWVGDQAVTARSQAVGPFEVKPGEYRIRVVRDGLPVFGTVVTIREGEQAEVWASWQEGAAAGPREVPTLEAAERRFEGHREPIASVGVTGDGRLISADVGGSVRTWDAATGRAGRVLEAHTGRISGLTVVAGGRYAVSAGDDLAIRVWDLTTGAIVRTLSTDLRSPLCCTAASPDGRLVALGAESGRVHVLDLGTGRELFNRSVVPATPSALAFAPDGRTLAVGVVPAPGADEPVALWEAETGRVIRELRGHRGAVWCAAFVPDGGRIVTGGSDATVRLWDVAKGRELRALRDHPGAVLGLAVSPDGRFALAGTGHHWDRGWRNAEAYGAQLWDLQTGRALGRLATEAPVRGVAFSPDGLTALAGGEERLVRSWKLPSAFEPHGANPAHVVWPLSEPSGRAEEPAEGS